MANKDAAFGFRPVGHLSGGMIRTREYSIAANYGQNIFRGQPVLAVTAGGIERATDTSGTVGLIAGVFAFILIQLHQNLHLANIILLALMLQILKLMYGMTLILYLRFNMMELEQRQ